MPKTIEIYIHGRKIADQVIWAQSFFARYKGLLGTTSLEEGQGCYLDPCHGIHCKGMAYPIDVVYLDSLRMVIATETVEPGKFGSKIAECASILELPQGQIEKQGIAAGQTFWIGQKVDG